MIILSCNNLNKSFGVDSILENVSFTINEGDKVGIVGVNGTGKRLYLRLFQVNTDTIAVIFTLLKIVKLVI